MTSDKEEAEQSPAGSSVREPTEDEIDLTLIGSFPASDPPSWTLGIARTNDASVNP
jgi:hypothetical protein